MIKNINVIEESEEEEPSPMIYQNMFNKNPNNKENINCNYHSININSVALLNKNKTGKVSEKIIMEDKYSQFPLKIESVSELMRQNKKQQPNFKLNEFQDKNNENLIKKIPLDKDKDNSYDDELNDDFEFSHQSPISIPIHNSKKMLDNSPIKNDNIADKQDFSRSSLALPGNINNKSERIYVISDASLKPRKGDKTPKSNESVIDPNEKLNFNFNIPIQNNNDLLELELEAHTNNEQLRINTENKDQILIDPEKIKNNTSISSENYYNQYDLQQLSYELVKEYSHLKIDKEEKFMQRMLFDIFKRQTKDERMDKLIDRNKRKIDERDRLKTFNRLIEDANRRLEAQEKLDWMRNKIDNNILAAPNKKKYKLDEWEEIYADRFLKYQFEKDKKIDMKLQIKIQDEKEKEDQILENLKTKKVPQNIINQSVKRMYEEAERRQYKLDERRKKNIKNTNYSDECFSEGENGDSIKQRDLTPSQFKKVEKVEKYNFQSDISGNEKSNTDEERDIYTKQGILSYSSKSTINLSSKKEKNGFKWLKKLNNSIINNSSSNRKDLTEQNKNNCNSNISNSRSNINVKNKNITSNTEFNNKRFNGEKSNLSQSKITNNSINTVTKSVKVSSNLSSKRSKKQYNIVDYVELEEESEISNIPKPINQTKLKESTNDKVMYDLKTLKNKYNNSKSSTANQKVYLPDYVASKLVDEILQNKIII